MRCSRAAFGGLDGGYVRYEVPGEGVDRTPRPPGIGAVRECRRRRDRQAPPRSLPEGPQILNARPKACVIVGDALSKMRAARVAGMRVVALTTTYPVEDLHQGARASALVNLQMAGRTGPTRGGEPRFELSILG